MRAGAIPNHQYEGSNGDAGRSTFLAVDRRLKKMHETSTECVRKASGRMNRPTTSTSTALQGRCGLETT